ncbi:hypothetical protein [Streptomyces sp. NPDC059788]|uniref:hypothetical protein n=1 Tax=Streptomyces sp. NPDC059788 TaxID=3346948 RepID=UPI003646F1AA
MTSSPNRIKLAYATSAGVVFRDVGTYVGTHVGTYGKAGRAGPGRNTNRSG